MKRPTINFSGILPRYEKGNMPSGNAVKAINADFFDGKLKGVLASSESSPISGSGRSLHKYKDNFYHDDGWHLNFTRNSQELHIYTDSDGSPKIQVDEDIDSLGIPVPDNIFSIVNKDNLGSLSGDYNYVITLTRELDGSNYVDESSPSGITNYTTDPTLTETVTITRPNITDINGFIRYWNIYRTINTGDGGSTFYFVAQVPIETTSYDDGLSDTDLLLNDILPSYSINYDLGQLGIPIFWTPPLDEVDGIAGDLKGNFFMWKDDTWYTNEPGQPQAWPIQYSQSVGSKIMAIICAESYATVLTESGIIHRIDYDKPILMRAEKTRGQNPCINSRAWTATPQGLMYLSDSGVAIFNGMESKVAFYYGFDETFYSKNVNNIDGVSMNYQDEKIFLFNPDVVGSGKNIVYDIRNMQKPFFYEVAESNPIVASYRDVPTGEIWVVTSGNGTTEILKFLSNSGGAVYPNVADPYRKAWCWKSGFIFDARKDYIYPKKVTVKGTGTDVTLKIYLDEVLIASKLLEWDTIFKRTLRFPSGSKGTNIQYELETQTGWTPEKGDLDFVEEVEVEYF